MRNPQSLIVDLRSWESEGGIAGNVFGEAADALEKMLAALTAALPLLEGFDDADFSREDGDEPIVEPVIAQVREAIGQ